jgi:hypothetical protein
MVAEYRQNSPTLNQRGGCRAVCVVLGITCHAVYHAGQIQLIKRLLSA